MSPYTEEFILNDKSIDVILHVANNGLLSNVSKTEFLSGNSAAVNNHMTIAKINKVSFIFIVLLMVIISIYLFFRMKREKSLLYFSFVVLMLIMIVLPDFDQKLLLDLPVNYILKAKFIRLTYIVLSLFFFLFMSQFLRGKSSIGRYRIYVYVNLIYALFVLILPLKMTDMLDSLLIMILIFPVILFIHKLLIIRTELHNTILLLLSGLALFNNLS